MRKKKTLIYNQLYYFLGGGGHQGRVNTGLGLTTLMLLSDSRLWLFQMWSQVLSNFKKGPNFSIALQPLVLPTLSICKYPQTYMYSEIWVKKKTKNNLEISRTGVICREKTILLNGLENRVILPFSHLFPQLIWAISMSWKAQNALTSLQECGIHLTPGTLWNTKASFLWNYGR